MYHSHPALLSEAGFWSFSPSSSLFGNSAGVGETDDDGEGKTVLEHSVSLSVAERTEWMDGRTCETHDASLWLFPASSAQLGDLDRADEMGSRIDSEQLQVQLV